MGLLLFNAIYALSY